MTYHKLRKIITENPNSLFWRWWDLRGKCRFLKFKGKGSNIICFTQSSMMGFQRFYFNRLN